MTGSDIDDFCREVESTYDGERYSVRDNGAVFRHPRKGKRPRPTDAQWTFGKPKSTGYMEIASVRVHRIVATAFHGPPPTAEHVVDHIDTNRRNNRPENLRWLTRLENALLNPITLKRIEFSCGSIERFLEDPSRLRHGKLEQNIAWMRTVSPEEARACFERLKLWAKSDKPASGGSLGEWVFKPITAQNQTSEPKEISPQVAQACREHMQLVAEGEKPLCDAPRVEVDSAPVSFQRRSPMTYYDPPALVMAKTHGAAQRDWRIPTEFPCCPQEAGQDPMSTYAQNLKPGAIFARNDLSVTAVLEAALTDDRQSLWVICEQRQEHPVKPWALAQITYEDGLYIHASCGTFFSREGADKQFCLALGREWAGEDSIDDYC